MKKPRSVHVEGLEWHYLPCLGRAVIISPYGGRYIALFFDRIPVTPSMIVDYIDRNILSSHEWYEEKKSSK